MKVISYLRFGLSKKTVKVVASGRPNYNALTSGQGSMEKTIPTVAFAVEFNIPDNLFRQAESVAAHINMARKPVRVCGTVEAPGKAE